MSFTIRNSTERDLVYEEIRICTGCASISEMFDFLVVNYFLNNAKNIVDKRKDNKNLLIAIAKLKSRVGGKKMTDTNHLMYAFSNMKRRIFDMCNKNITSSTIMEYIKMELERHSLNPFDELGRAQIMKIDEIFLDDMKKRIMDHKRKLGAMNMKAMGFDYYSVDTPTRVEMTLDDAYKENTDGKF